MTAIKVEFLLYNDSENILNFKSYNYINLYETKIFNMKVERERFKIDTYYLCFHEKR